MHANEPQFALEIDDFICADTFLLSFRLNNYEFSSNYSIFLKLISKKKIIADDILGHRAKITIYNSNSNKYLHGILRSLYLDEYVGLESVYTYNILLFSPISLLENHVVSSVFSNTSLQDIFDSLLLSSGLLPNEFVISLSKHYAPLELRMQYKMDCLTFLVALLKEYGLIYFFKQQAQSYKLVITDNLDVLHQSEVKNNKYLLIKQKSVDCDGKKIFLGSVVGDFVDMDLNSVFFKNNQKLRVFSININAEQTDLCNFCGRKNKQAVYEMSFIAVSCEQSTGDVRHERGCDILPAPINHLLPVIMGENQFSFPFGTIDSAMLLAQASSFSAYIPKDSKVVLYCLDGRVENAVIVGVLPTESQISPIISSNNYQHCINTNDGNDFVVQDLQNDGYLLLASSNLSSSSILYSQQNNKRIELQAKKSDILFSSKDFFKCKTDNFLLESSITSNKYIDGNYFSQTKSGNIKYLSKNNVYFCAGSDISFLQKLDVKLLVFRNCEISACDKLNMVNCSDFLCHSFFGDINIFADNNVVFTADQAITMNNDFMFIDFCNGSCSIKTNRLNLQAHELFFYGAASLNAGANAVVHVPDIDKQKSNKELLNIVWRNDYHANRSVMINGDYIRVSYGTHKTLISVASNRSTLPEASVGQLVNVQAPSAIIGVNDVPQFPSSRSKFYVRRRNEIKLLTQPVIKNSRKNDVLLSQKELEYFKAANRTAIVFIHGFNVPFGCFPKELVSVNYSKEYVLETNIKKWLIKSTPIFDKSYCSVYRNIDLITSCFPVPKKFSDFLLDSMDWFADDQRLNGCDAHNWLIHMENNLNSAAGFFDHTDYSKYRRIINYAWPGDKYGGGLKNSFLYIENEEGANQAGHKLVKLFDQLKRYDIKIYVIAHSLGNRVLLTAMNDLGLSNKDNYLEQVFLWEAAVPNTALSNDIQLDTTFKRNGSFIYAHKAAKKFTVLSSRHDEILNIAYWLAEYLGVSPRKLFTQRGREQFRQQFHKSIWGLVDNVIERLLDDSTLRLLMFGPEIHKCKLLADILGWLNKELIAKKIGHYVMPAMGYAGVDNSTKRLLGDKLYSIDQSNWLYSHSGMKIPSQTMTDMVYKRWIVNDDYGIKRGFFML
ncbi:MAG: alpha/beta hydrolase [Gammaproteobacteria bacterium]|nr:alpha/beta hydrolase [Gammaproteobacteria bacterium]